MPKKRKKKYGESHMEAGLSYKGNPQGYYSPGGKPKGRYGKPPNGYINQAGMPNASKTRKALEYMSSHYGGKGATGSSSTNAGTSPNVSSMDPTYRKGKKKYR